ncbi:hypothetical protein [Hymenobacter crusticola]|uniref:Uncharacterized protein n=1 Tax=Hymenobacter crusticola TaxID=1770526 RepID=A0A243WFP6_9BACT|nr:hypothetical protein [Hymenobacter crusticola]OUJ73977.1 hypothetical protein BXP70_09470 [Hymenobacter crusticola]
MTLASLDPKNPANPALKDTAAQNTTDSQPATTNALPLTEEVPEATPQAQATAASPPSTPSSEEATTQEDTLADPQASDADTGGYDDTDTGVSNDADVHPL